MYSETASMIQIAEMPDIALMANVKEQKDGKCQCSNYTVKEYKYEQYSAPLISLRNNVESIQ